MTVLGGAEETTDAGIGKDLSSVWREYERRKQALKREFLSADEYALRLREIIDELGV